MTIQPDVKAVQKAVNALIKALGYPESGISRIEIECSGYIRLWMRDKAVIRATHVAPFKKEEK